MCIRDSDDPMQVKEISKLCKLYLQNHSYSAKIEEYTNTMLFLESNYLELNLILLDIDMPVYNGIEIARKIKNVNQACFICFITDYSDYIFESYEVPVSYTHLFWDFKGIGEAGNSR